MTIQPLTEQDLEGLPPELLKELNVTKSKQKRMMLMRILPSDGSFVNLDYLLVHAYKLTNEVYTREKMINLTHLAKKEGWLRASGDGRYGRVLADAQGHRLTVINR